MSDVLQMVNSKYIGKWFLRIIFGNSFVYYIALEKSKRFITRNGSKNGNQLQESIKKYCTEKVSYTLIYLF